MSARLGRSSTRGCSTPTTQRFVDVDGENLEELKLVLQSSPEASVVDRRAHMETYGYRRPSTHSIPSFKNLHEACACASDLPTRPLLLGDARNTLGADWHTVSAFNIGRELGFGASSTVRQASCKHGSVHVAVKKIGKHTASAKLVPTELKTLQRVQGHPNIITLVNSFEDNDFVYIVTSFCPNGTLLEYLVENGASTEQRARTWLRQLVDATKHCHDRGVVNRDIKLDNILLDVDHNLVVADFGLAVLCDNPSTTRLSTSSGSPVFAAPEVYDAKRAPYLGAPADMWSIGAVLHCLVTGSLPFDVDDFKSEWQTYKPPAHLSPECRDLLSKLLYVDPSKRPSAQQVLEHPFLASARHSMPPSPFKSA